MFYNSTKANANKTGLIVLAMVFLAILVSALLNDSTFVSYYKMDDTTGVLATDSQGAINGTLLEGVLDQQKGLINASFYFNGTDAAGLGYINFTTLSTACFDFNCSVSMWTNNSRLGTSYYYTEGDGSNVGDYVTFGHGLATGSRYNIRIFDDGAGDTLNSAQALGGNNNPVFQHVVFILNTTSMLIYINGTFDNQTAITASALSSQRFSGMGHLFEGSPGGDVFRGNMDEVGIWNKELTSEEVTRLYNGGNGLAFPFSEVAVFLNSPQNDSTFSSRNLEFNATLTPINVTLINATFHLWNSTNDLVNTTNISVTGVVSNDSIFNISGIPFGESTWNVLGCGTNETGGVLCSFANLNFSLTSGFLVNNITFNSPVTEVSQQIFSLNLTYDLTTHNLDPRFHYNNTIFTPSTAIVGGDTILTNQILVPGIVTAVNETLFWDLEFTDVDTSAVFSFNTTQNNQSILPLGIDDCGVFTNEIFNFTMVDEETQIILNGSALNSSTDMDIAINVFDSFRQTKVITFSNNFTINPIRICLESALLNDSDYLLDAIINYEVEGVYASEFYNLANVSLNEDFVAREITLFDLNLSDSTAFQLTFTGIDFLPQGDVLINVDRQYIAENVFKTVELPITDTDGKTVIHLVRNDVIYNIRMIKEGALIGNFERIRAFCDDPLLQNCQLSLGASSSISGFTFDEATGLAFSSVPTFDPNASTVSFDFVVVSGIPKTINMNVTRNDIFGNRTVCENSVTSASGTVLCSIDPGITDTRLITAVSVDGVGVILSTVDISLSDFGPVGYTMWFILTLILIFIFGENKSFVLISLLVSYVGATLMGINTSAILGSTSAGVVSAGLWIIVITVLGLWRLNREKIQ